MKKKMSILIIAIALFIGALSFGVYSFYNIKENANGRINFTTYEADVDVDVNITSNSGVSNDFLGTSNTFRSPSRQFIFNAPWKFADLPYTSEMAGNSYDINIGIKISNYSNFGIETSITAPALAGVIINISNPATYSYPYDSSLGAEEKIYQINIKPDLSVTNRNTNFSFNINIIKSLKLMDVSKFQASAPVNGEISITGHNLSASDTDIVIPRKIGDNLVTKIENYAFSVCKTVKTIVVPNGVTKIGNYSFNYCNAMTDIDIPDSLTDIGSYAFRMCTSLLNIKLPENLIKISSSAFEDCSSLTKIMIPSKVTTIEYGVFKGCKKLPKIEVSTANLNYSNDEYGVLFNKDKTTLVEYPGGGAKSYQIPDGVKTIGTNAFYNRDITDVLIPNGVTSIESSAFSGSSLTSINIPGSVKTIGVSSFYSCSVLKEIIIPDGVTTVKDFAFNYCRGAKNVSISKSVTSIGREAFANGDSTTKIEVSAENKNYSSDSFGVLFNKDKTILIQYPISGSTTYEIPFGVNIIDSFSFDNCKKLTSITIPNSVTIVSGFSNCIGLTTITIPSSVSSIGNSAFDYCSNLTTVYIERTTPFTLVGTGCFKTIKNTSILYFKNQTVSDQFIAGTHFDSAKTVKVIY